MLNPTDLYYRYLMELQFRGFVCNRCPWSNIKAMYENKHAFWFESFMGESKAFQSVIDGVLYRVEQDEQSDPASGEGSVRFYKVNDDDVGKELIASGESLKDVIYEVPIKGQGATARYQRSVVYEDGVPVNVGGDPFGPDPRDKQGVLL